VAGAAFVGLMLVAGWTVHRTKWVLQRQSGWEYNFILATIGITLGTTGAGRYSLDYILGLTGVFSRAGRLPRRRRRRPRTLGSRN